MRNVDAINVPDTAGGLADLGDEALLRLARDGHQEAYAALFTRYSYAGLRLARHLGQREDSDDVVSESFAQVLDLVRRGKGPERAFRAYLFTTIRHEAARRAKARRRVVPTDDDQQIDQAVPFGGGRLDDFERTAIRAAYESLPQRWRTVLWYLDVEGRKPHELGPLLDLSPNSVSALVYRARSGLREAYLQQHVKSDDDLSSRSCREVRTKLSAFVRRTASAREQERVHTHLDGCKGCMAVYLDLQEVNRDVGSILLPGAVAVSLSGAAAVGAATTVSAVAGVGSLLTQLAFLGKGVAVALVPPAAAATLATAALVGVGVAPQVEAASPFISTPTVDAPPATRTDAAATPTTSVRGVVVAAVPEAARPASDPLVVPAASAREPHDSRAARATVVDVAPAAVDDSGEHAQDDRRIAAVAPPVAATPVETVPPVDEGTVETTPPVETVPDETKPVDTVPVEQPQPVEPADDEPAATSPVETQPVP